MDWPLATWTLSTEAPRELLEAVLRELGYQHMVACIKGAGDGLQVDLIGLDRERPSVELERIRLMLVKLGQQAECSLLR